MRILDEELRIPDALQSNFVYAYDVPTQGIQSKVTYKGEWVLKESICGEYNREIIEKLYKAGLYPKFVLEHPQKLWVKKVRIWDNGIGCSTANYMKLQILKILLRLGIIEATGRFWFDDHNGNIGVDDQDRLVLIDEGFIMLPGDLGESYDTLLEDIDKRLYNDINHYEWQRDRDRMLKKMLGG